MPAPLRSKPESLRRERKKESDRVLSSVVETGQQQRRAAPRLPPSPQGRPRPVSSAFPSPPGSGPAPSRAPSGDSRARPALAPPPPGTRSGRGGRTQARPRRSEVAPRWRACRRCASASSRRARSRCRRWGWMAARPTSSRSPCPRTWRAWRSASTSARAPAPRRTSRVRPAAPGPSRARRRMRKVRGGGPAAGPRAWALSPGCSWGRPAQLWALRPAAAQALGPGLPSPVDTRGWPWIRPGYSLRNPSKLQCESGKG